MVEETHWNEQFPKKPEMNSKATLKTKIQIKEPVPILSTYKTRSGRQVIHKKIADDEITDFTEEPSFEDIIKPPPAQITVEILPENVPIINQSQSIELKNADPYDQKSPSQPSLTQPDAHDLSNVVIEGTDTESLVHECLLCSKKMLGRHALGRHMKIRHPASLGPYKCPISESCGKILESGPKILTHMYHHIGKRALAISKGQKFSCSFENVSINCMIGHGNNA